VLNLVAYIVCSRAKAGSVTSIVQLLRRPIRYTL